jgi:hypothetical protein
MVLLIFTVQEINTLNIIQQLNLEWMNMEFLKKLYKIKYFSSKIKPA